MSDIHETDILAETDDLAIWRSKEDEVGYIYHLEFGNLTIHLSPEEWDELVILIREASK
ncbi:MAG: hypothetical protein WAM60_01835 [Candidatus Promineifilaceae bacterium]